MTYQERIENYEKIFKREYVPGNISSVLVIEEKEYVCLLGAIGDFTVYEDMFGRFDNIESPPERHALIATYGEKVWEENIIEKFRENSVLNYRL